MTAKPVSTIAGPTELVYSDADRTRLVAENIDDLYCGEEPKPDWCAVLHRVDGKPDVAVEATSLFVATTLADTSKGRKLGDAMCKAIAAAAFDENGIAIGFRHVHVQAADPDVFVGDCDVTD